MFDISKLSKEQLDAGSKPSQAFLNELQAKHGPHYASAVISALDMRSQLPDILESQGDKGANAAVGKMTLMLAIMCKVIGVEGKELLADADKLAQIASDEVDALKKLHGE